MNSKPVTCQNEDYGQRSRREMKKKKDKRMPVLDGDRLWVCNIQKSDVLRLASGEEEGSSGFQPS